MNGKHNQTRRATTAQILGGVAREPEPVRPEWQQHYERLIQLRSEVGRRKDALAETAHQEVAGAFGMHMADAGTDEFDRDMALSFVSSDQNALYEIEEALTRMSNGTYGICELTGKAIEPERLAAVPWTRFSAEAQRELESSGVTSRVRLAARGSLTEPAIEAEAESDEQAAA